MNQTETLRRSLLAASICAALASTSATAATFNVTNTNDSGAGSLRQALIDANANSEADTINLSSISGQTITLTSGQLYAEDEITINGAGVTIDADGASRVMAANGGPLELNDLTLTGGFLDLPVRGSDEFGGGLAFEGEQLTLNNTTITQNTAVVGGGLAVQAYYLEINNSIISDNTALDYAGGLYGYTVYGATLSDTTISGNSSELTGGTRSDSRLVERFGDRGGLLRDRLRGGGKGPSGALAGGIIGGFGDIRIERSTISGNQAAGPIGGLFAYAYGRVELIDSTVSGNSSGNFLGGFAGLSKYDELVVSNSTIEGNSATGPVGGTYLTSYASSTIEFSTVTGNTSSLGAGGLYYLQYGTGLQHNATIVSGNTAPVDPDLGLDPGATVDAEFSLVGVAPGAGTLNPDAATISLLGSDPGLGSLGNNGGPTQTQVPFPGSAVIDQVPSGSSGCGTTVTSDQRGNPRPFGAACDIGAVEFGPSDGAAVAVPTLNRMGLLLMAGLLGLAAFFGFRRSPQRQRS